MTIQEVLRENERRHAILNQAYDPIVGIGSPLPRFKFTLRKGASIYLPTSMEQHHVVRAMVRAGSLMAWAAKNQYTYKSALNKLSKLRVGHDFEFWCASCVMIRPKIQTTEGGLIPFVLNPPQRKLLYELEVQRLANMPIRMIVLKHRQWGATTMVQLYLAWIQLFHRLFWNAEIVTDVKAKSAHIRGMFETMARNHPEDTIPGVTSLRLDRYQGLQDHRVIPSRGNIIGLSSVENPNASRSWTLHLLHLSEVGFWKSTPTVNASALAQSLVGSLPSEPYTVSVKESTASGVGTYFHGEWVRAMKKESNDVPLFVTWFEDPQYTMEVTDPLSFWESLSTYERYQWTMGATLEHIRWYRWKRQEFDSHFRMQAEFPTTPQEAFQTTGQRVFEPERVQLARATCRVPIATGFLHGTARKGKNSLSGVKWEDNTRGNVRIWSFPHKAGIEQPGKLYVNRYCAFADTGGRSKGSDYSVIRVLDRIWTLQGGVPTIAAEFQDIMDQDLFAWVCARISSWYGNALLAVEVNKLYDNDRDTLDGREPEHGTTILDEIKDYYPNLYYRVRPEQIQDKWDGVLGFHTNKETKNVIIDNLNGALRDRSYEEVSLAVCDELDSYEFKPGGKKMGATDKAHDDLVMATAGVVWLSGTMDPVREIDAVPKKKEKQKTGYSTFS